MKEQSSLNIFSVENENEISLKTSDFHTFFKPVLRKSCLWSMNHALKAEIMLYVAFWYHSAYIVRWTGYLMPLTTLY